MCPSATADLPTQKGPPPPPPNDNGGSGDGSGNWEQNNSGPPMSLGRIGLMFIIAGAVMLFAAFMTGYVVLRFGSEEWPPAGSPALPSTLWYSTILIALSSIPAQLAVRAARMANALRLQRMIALTLLLGLAFCAVQSMIWDNLVRDGLTLRSSQLGSNFYCLTVLHVVHVLGGIAYLGVALRDAFKRRFTAENHERVPNCMMYWHFVGVLWYALFAALYLL